MLLPQLSPCQAAKAAYKTACSTLKAKLRTMQNDCWTKLVERTQRCADIGDMHAFYEALIAICGPAHQIQAPLCCFDGSTLLTDILRASSVIDALCRSLQ